MNSSRCSHLLRYEHCGAASTLPPFGGEGRPAQRSCDGRGGGPTLAPRPRLPPTPDPSPPLASLAGGGECQSERRCDVRLGTAKRASCLRVSPRPPLPILPCFHAARSDPGIGAPEK